MNIIDLPWAVPLTVHFQNGTDHIFRGPYDALDFLENEWPSRRGQKYDRAIMLCGASLDKEAPIALAREAFIAACLETGMAVETIPLIKRPQ